MSKERSRLKTLLLQIRHDEQVKKEEHDSFIKYSGLMPQQIDVLNVYENPDFNLNAVDDYDALFVGGTSNANVLEPQKYSFVSQCQDMMKYCLDKNIPVFASCFGFQLAVLALNGEIIHKEKDFEMGILPMKLSPAAIEDTLYKDTPNNFKAITVHQQLALKAPPQSTLLAYTDQCCHSFKVKERLFWAFQFHPEVDKQVLIDRLTLYKNKYTNDDGHLARILSNAQETPESNLLVQKFVDRVLLKM
jgi:GMP synthase (glutamine-hydrolysing)